MGWIQRARWALWSHDFSDAGKSAIGRLLAILITTSITLYSWRKIAYGNGPDVVGFVSLVVSFPALIPFVDLGLGAAIVNVVGEHKHREEIQAVVVRVLQLLTLVALLMVALAVFLLPTSLWTPLLGPVSQRIGYSGLGASLFVIAWSLAVPLGVGERLLLGIGHNWINVINGILPAVVTALVITALRSTNISPGLWPIAFGVGALAGSLSAFILAYKTVREIFRGILPHLMHWRSSRELRLLDTSLPMLVISIASPLALQSDRLILGHRGTTQDLATYAAAMWIYAPGSSVVAMAGIALWPALARRRAAGSVSWHVQSRLMFISGGLALALGCGMLVVGPVVARIVLGSSPVQLLEVLLAMAGLLLAQAVHMPNGYLQTDPAGLRFQAVALAVMLPVNVALSWAWAARLGAVGPVLASLATWVFIVTLPVALRARRFTSS